GNTPGKVGSGLAAIKREVLPDDTYVYKINGTSHYFKNTSPQRLYVKWKGLEIDAKLPCEMYCIGSHGNSLYFTTMKKVYKASFSPSALITVSFVRDKVEGEVFDKLGLSSRVRNGKRYVYRVSDNPDRDGILINISERELKRLRLIGIHRGKAIFVSTTASKYRPSAYKVGENVIVIEASLHALNAYICDSSPFIYLLIWAKDIHTLDTRSMRFLPPLNIGDVDEITYIAGVHKGRMTVEGLIDHDFYAVTAQLPIGHFLNATPDVDLEIAHIIEDKIKSISQ
ncbi:hypothetical protein PMAYCL1PPCAC_17090, partial [Pristionchus mayeri]